MIYAMMQANGNARFEAERMMQEIQKQIERRGQKTNQAVRNGLGRGTGIAEIPVVSFGDKG